MVVVRSQSPGVFQNYHSTINRNIADIATLIDDASGDVPADRWFKETARAIGRFVGDARRAWREVSVVGAGWSFAPLCGTTGAVLNTNALSRAFAVEQACLDGNSPYTADMLAFVGGGIRLRALNEWLLNCGLSIRTSGSFDGQAFAGAIATSTHGSVVGFADTKRQSPGYGGMQDHVVGMHLVTAAKKTVWLERASRPAFTDRYAKRFAGDIIRDDEMFEAALVHLGGMGVVNALLLDVEPLFYCGIVDQVRLISEAWLEKMAAGDFAWIAGQFGDYGSPYFYELTIDPHDPFTTPAMHKLLFKTDPPSAPCAPEDCKQMLNLMRPDANEAPNATAPQEMAQRGPCIDVPPGFHLTRFLLSQFEEKPESGKPWDVRSWGEIHGEHRRQAPLYNSAYAIERSRLPEAIDILSSAVQGLKPVFVFTLRFVSQAAGVLAFTRFPETVVINLDGIETCDEPTCAIAADRIAAALETAGIPFSLHWGKLGGHGPHRLITNFGDPSTPGTPAFKWRSARERLVPKDMRQIFGNDALRRLGLI